MKALLETTKKTFLRLIRQEPSERKKAALLMRDVRNLFAPVIKNLNIRVPQDEEGRRFRLITNLDLSWKWLLPPSVNLKICHLNDKETEAMKWFMTEGSAYAMYRGGSIQEAQRSDLAFSTLAERSFDLTLELAQCFKNNSMVFFGMRRRSIIPATYTGNFSDVTDALEEYFFGEGALFAGKNFPDRPEPRKITLASQLVTSKPV